MKNMEYEIRELVGDGGQTARRTTKWRRNDDEGERRAWRQAAVLRGLQGISIRGHLRLRLLLAGRQREALLRPVQVAGCLGVSQDAAISRCLA